jgi:hypothetical protein
MSERVPGTDGCGTIHGHNKYQIVSADRKKRGPQNSTLGKPINLSFLDNVPHLSYINKNSKGGKPWAKQPQSGLELNPI